MGIESIIASRYAILPGRRSLSYQARSGTTWDTAVTIANAERRNPDRTEPSREIGSAYTATGITYHLWKEWCDLVSVTPKQGDKFTDSSTSETFTVESVDTEMLGNRYRLICQRARS